MFAQKIKATHPAVAETFQSSYVANMVGNSDEDHTGQQC